MRASLVLSDRRLALCPAPNGWDRPGTTLSPDRAIRSRAATLKMWNSPKAFAANRVATHIDSAKAGCRTTGGMPNYPEQVR